MAEKLTRRVVLGAIGATALSGVVSGDHDHDDCTDCKDQRGEKTCSYHCGDPTKDKRKTDWWDSIITLQNCGGCTRVARVTAKHCIHERQELGDRRPSELPREMEVTLKPHERITLYFQGPIRGLATEASDINIAITQRTERQTNYCE